MRKCASVFIKTLRPSWSYSSIGPSSRDPGADSGDEGKSKRAEKCDAKKSKERREEPLGTMSYQTGSKRSPPFWLLIGARKLLCFSAQSEASRPMGRFVYPYTE